MNIIMPTNIEFDDKNPVHVALQEALKANKRLQEQLIKMSIDYRTQIAGIKMRCTCTEYKNNNNPTT